MTSAALIWCPFPDEAEAREVATRLLDEGLVACANLIPGMISLYQWQGERGEAREVGALFKTRGDLAPAAIARLGQLHSYETPAIIGWDAGACSPATLDWIASLPESGFGA